MTVQQMIDALEQYSDKRHEVLTADGHRIETIGTCVIDALPSSLRKGEWLEYKQCVLLEGFRPHPFWKVPPLIQDRMIRDSWQHLGFWGKIKVLFFGKEMPIVRDELRIKGIKAIWQELFWQGKNESERMSIKDIKPVPMPEKKENIAESRLMGDVLVLDPNKTYSFKLRSDNDE